MRPAEANRYLHNEGCTALLSGTGVTQGCDDNHTGMFAETKGYLRPTGVQARKTLAVCHNVGEEAL